MKYWRELLLVSLLSLSVTGATPVAQAREIPADSPKIQYFGRWDAQDGVYRCGYGATYIKTVFTGTSLTANLADNGIWWKVSIDGGRFRRLQSQGEHTVLAENLSPGMHTALLVRLTEGRAGISEFRGFILDEHHTLLKPEPMKKHRLEFVGDSITAGAMNMGRYIPAKNNYHAVEDGDMAYGPQLARMLDADCSIVAKSGQGVAHNYTEQPPYNGVHAADSYEWTFFYDQFSPENLHWDAAKFPVDATIIALGTNDFTGRDHLSKEDFQAGYRKLLANVRRMNPGKPIICLEPLPSCQGTEPRLWIQETVAELTATGEPQIYFIPVNEEKPLLSPSDYTDGDTHPNVKGSALLAKYLKDKVAAILGWQ